MNNQKIHIYVINKDGLLLKSVWYYVPNKNIFEDALIKALVNNKGKYNSKENCYDFNGLKVYIDINHTYTFNKIYHEYQYPIATLIKDIRNLPGSTNKPQPSWTRRRNRERNTE